MKLAAFDGNRLGVITGDTIADLSPDLGNDIAGLRPAYRMNGVIAAFEQLRGKLTAAAQRADRTLGAVNLNAPLTRPTVMLCAFDNYKLGVAHTPRMPAFVLKPASAILDPGGTIVLPDMDAGAFHHEAELAVVIGRRAHNVSEQNAMEHVFGYTCMIDVTARGYDHGVIVNGFDTFCPLGPWIVTGDEIADPHNLQVRLWVNDVLRQDYNTGDMEHRIPELIAWLSTHTTLEPGDIIACGTDYRGVGPLQDGETCALEIEAIGRLTAQVRDPLRRSWSVGVDPAIGAAIRRMHETNGPFNAAAAFTPRIYSRSTPT
jgi:2-keto-4-pentenoate hydratase/2-oxohepta-3-ene-1,7-dioic acid hydratase in catechol pathway